MALDRLKLKSELMLFLDEKNFPGDYWGAAENFSNAINNYALTITPTSTNFELVRKEFVDMFMSSRRKENIEILIDSIKWYCSTLAIGMQTPGYTVTSPVGGGALSIGLRALAENSLKGMSASDWAETASQIIDAYFRTGTVIQVGTGIVVPWS